MLLSIITCTYNSSKYLRETLASAQVQSYQDFEHIFIDGGSTDDTLAIISDYQHANKVVISEKDAGIYDALNKGLRLATGDIIGVLHSDDLWSNDNCLRRVVTAFDGGDYDYYSARMGVYNESLNKLMATLGAPQHRLTWRDVLYSSNYFAHPTVFIRKELFVKLGYFDLQYQVAADIDWLWRLESLTDKEFFDDFELVKMRHVGTSAKNFFAGLLEEFRIAIRIFGWRPLVVFAYSYHFLRRSLRYVFEKCYLHGLVDFARLINNKLLK